MQGCGGCLQPFFSGQLWGDSEDLKAGRGWRVCFRCVGEGRCALAGFLCQVDAPCGCEGQQEPQGGGDMSECRSRAVISARVSRAHLHR